MLSTKLLTTITTKYHMLINITKLQLISYVKVDLDAGDPAPAPSARGPVHYAIHINSRNINEHSSTTNNDNTKHINTNTNDTNTNNTDTNNDSSKDNDNSNSNNTYNYFTRRTSAVLLQ